ncbi:MAG TPA: hypothetical protein VFT65_12380 [Candidatus Angelobacter sp.]|nr:hypothetical protein [Candidatus Angelobacter sp.]
MATRSLLFSLILILAFVSDAVGQYEPPLLCEGKALSADWPPSSPAELVDQHLLFKSSTKNSWASLTLKNRNSSPLVQIVAAVEVLDKNQQHLATLIVRDIAPGAAGTLAPVPGYPGADAGDLLKPVYPSENAKIVLSSPKVVSGCPASARLVSLRLDSLSGETFTYVKPGNRTDPYLLQADLASLSPPPLNAKFEQLVTIRINEEGKANIPELDGDVTVVRWLNDFVSLLKFSPASFDGTPLPDTSELLVRFHKRPKLDWRGVVKYRSAKTTFSVLDIYPVPNQSHKREIFFAGEPLN